MFKTLVDGMKDVQVKTLNPIAPLTEEKFDRILKDLRLKLQLKGMSYEDFFNLLDAGHNGFITITDFSEQVEKVMSLSQPAKDGFFAFMDRKQIGLIDLNTFLRNIGKSIVQKMPELQEDDFDWELEILFKIRNWCKRENLTVEDAFRTFDKDFDGEISKGDIRLFIVDMLKIEEKLITEARLNRLFKLMDQFKRGRITLMDFRRFLEEGVFYGQNK
jgi:Ca2+-binding EF-hand superfamily protein